MPENASIRYCYYRDEANAPRITICRYEEDGFVVYGWSICSLRDTPCKKTGRSIALQRAKYAFHNTDSAWQFPRIYLNNATSPRHDGARKMMRQCDAYGFRDLVDSGNVSNLMKYMQ